MANNQQPSPSKDKAETYTLIGDLICKLLLVIAIIVGWLALVFFVIKNPSVPLGIAAGNLPMLMTLLIQHFFPKRK